jgi:hypothetical protein
MSWSVVRHESQRMCDAGGAALLDGGRGREGDGGRSHDAAGGQGSPACQANFLAQQVSAGALLALRDGIAGQKSVRTYNCGMYTLQGPGTCEQYATVHIASLPPCAAN